MRFFPADTIEWRVLEPTFVRRLSISLVAMAIGTGVIVRLYRVLVFRVVPREHLVLFLVAAALGVVLLASLVTLHLGNYPVRQWLWRAPVFGILQSAASMLVSAVLVAAGMERIGSDVMHWSHWRSDMLWTLVRNEAFVCLYALILAAAVQIVRRAFLRREHREHTLDAVRSER
jgi:hypothetical protein